MGNLESSQLDRNIAMVVNRMERMACPEAKHRLAKSRGLVRDWLRSVFSQNFTKADRFEVDPNRLWERGYGLESYNVRLTRGNEEILPEGFLKAPTVGVLASGLLPDGALSVVDFVPDEVEKITGLSYPGIAAAPASLWSEDLSRNGLTPRNSFEVAAPDAIKAVLRVDSNRVECEVLPEAVLAQVGNMINGVYGCRFLKREK